MRRTYKYRLFPSKAQATCLRQTLDTCCVLYNTALEERIGAWRKQRVSLNFYTQCVQLKGLGLADVYAQVLQDVLRRLDKAFKAFFRRVNIGQTPGFPRFKARRRYKSFTYPQSGFSIEGDHLRLSKVGDVHVKLHRSVIGKIKTCSICRDGDKWFVCFSVEQDEVHTVSRNTDTAGIDVGLEHFLTLSTGDHISNPRLYRRAEKRLARLQRKRSKAAGRVARKVRNQRLDFLHKLSRSLVNRFNTLVVEDLNIRGMTQSDLRGIPKSVNDAGWGQFVQFLEYKAAEAGGRVVRVSPELTSQICPECGTVKKKELGCRWHWCECGCSMHRDRAAALAILQKGLGKARPGSKS